ncbi:hypothetical protein [Mesorhizobium sp. 2RAF21]|uniref:hypothetical protein n=1 Tax=Mesorhizobium sp. 2RAF21 TaxID=3232995 RepID=UPI003F987F1D
MPTTRAYITPTEVTRAVSPVKKAVAAGKPVPAGMAVISDVHLKGLRLISVGGIVSWAMKTSIHTKTLGYAYPDDEWPLTAPEKAREYGGYVKALLKTDPEKVDPYLAHRHSGKGHEEALAAIAEKPASWTLRECFEQTIQDKRHPSARKKIGAAQESDLRITMARDCAQQVMDAPAAAVTQGDIEGVRDTIVKEAVAKGQSGVSPSNKWVTHVRSVLDHCAGHHQKAGLSPDRPWWQLIKTKFENPVRTRMPSIEEIVSTMLLAEEYLDKPLPGRAIQKAGVGHGVLAGLWWVILAAQRVNAGLSLRAHDIVEDPERPGTGWMLAAWDKEDMKAGKSFVLPVPARAWKFIDAFREKNVKGASDDWAFPSERKPEVHASVSGVYRILYRLAGRDALLRPPKEGEVKQPRLKADGTPRRKPTRTERRNLIEEAGITWWSMHDDRRTLTAFLKSKKIPGGASAILAHEVDDSEGLKASATERQRKDFQRQRTAKITAMAYGNEAQFLELKSEAMELWTNAVLDEFDRQKAKRRAQAVAPELGGEIAA